MLERMRGCSRRVVLATACVIAAGASVRGQMTPLTTTLATIERHPTFFHVRVLSLVGTPTLVGDQWRLPRAGSGDFVIILKVGGLPGQAVELRGQLFDVGRLEADDTRLSSSGIRQIAQALYGERWPSRGDLLVLVGATWTDDVAPAPTVRSIALHPDAFEGKSVTIRGRFRAQNLFADLPAWPRKSQWDFVLQSADAAVWVTGLRPRGRGFDLNPRQRLGSRTWLEITGKVTVVDTLPTIEATSVALTAPEDEPPPPAGPEPLLAPEPPAIVFSAPMDGDIDVDRDAPIRIQFSGDMKEASFEGTVLVSYEAPAGAKVPPFKVLYQPGTRSIEVRFEHPLEPAASVRVELSEGIESRDGQRLASLTITFRTRA